MTEPIEPSGRIEELRPEPWDPLHLPRNPAGTWSTTNIGEAVPGVPTPLGWSLWSKRVAQSSLDGFHAVGALTRREATLSEDRDDWHLWAFYGRGAIRVETVAGFADRIPGTDGPAIAEQLLGRCPDHITARPVYRRYPVVAVKLPWTFATVGRMLARVRTETEQWYRRHISTVDQLDQRATTTLFVDACDRFQRCVSAQAVSLFGAVQPLYDAITRLSRIASTDPNAIMGGYGSHAETDLVVDLWKAAHDELTVDELVSRHGYHGPDEGELSARVWREDPTPLRKRVEDYKRLPDERNPLLLATELVERRRKLERELIAGLPRGLRPSGRLVLWMGRRYIPTRGTAKVSFLQATDVARACAHRLGALHHQAGAIDDPEDVFYLTTEELAAGLPGDARELIERRRERRRRYREMWLPSSWSGMPTPTIAADAVPDTAAGREHVSGIGVSSGRVEGTAMVVLDPEFADVDSDTVLIAPTTDPSWASVMYLSAALVVDIGGALSHAAIVARELGIPCVVNTIDGTRTIRTGDRVAVDGGTGTVQILQRAPQA